MSPFPSCNNFSKINFPRILPNSVVCDKIFFFDLIVNHWTLCMCVCVYHARHHLEWKYSEFFAASLSRGFASEEAYATRYSNRCITCVITWPRLVRTYVLATCVKIHAILSSYTAVQYFSMLWIGARGWRERERGKGSSWIRIGKRSRVQCVVYTISRDKVCKLVVNRLLRLLEFNPLMISLLLMI